jgi:ribonuclease BN (tRNA processing enzyme)
MDLIFLGTSAGVPTRSRNVSGTALIEPTGKGWYLVDCGEATQQQMLRTAVITRTAWMLHHPRTRRSLLRLTGLAGERRNVGES